jgi:hypothetical protein
LKKRLINKRNSSRIFGIISACIVLIVPYLLLLNNNNLEDKQSTCLIKLTTGFPCPLCGITKSIVYFYDGNILKSFGYHLLGPLLVSVCLFLIVLFSVEIITNRTYLRKWSFSRKLAYYLVVFLISYHIIRLFYFIDENSWDEILKQSIWK